jgi:multisubunit Na+/H+ antiporter MnhB subunit
MNNMEKRIIAGALALTIVAVFFSFSIFLLHPFGDPGEVQMDDHIIVNTQNETGTNNAVTSIVFDYRGFDTLGEATILFSAVAGVIMIFRRVKE